MKARINFRISNDTVELVILLINRTIDLWKINCISSLCSCGTLVSTFLNLQLKEIGINTRDWVDSAQVGDYWRAPVNAALNFRVP